MSRPATPRKRELKHLQDKIGLLEWKLKATVEGRLAERAKARADEQKLLKQYLAERRRARVATATVAKLVEAFATLPPTLRARAHLDRARDHVRTLLGQAESAGSLSDAELLRVHGAAFRVGRALALVEAWLDEARGAMRATNSLVEHLEAQFPPDAPGDVPADAPPEPPPA